MGYGGVGIWGMYTEYLGFLSELNSSGKCADRSTSQSNCVCMLGYIYISRTQHYTQTFHTGQPHPIDYYAIPKTRNQLTSTP